MTPSAVADLTLFPADVDRGSGLRAVDSFAATRASGLNPARRVGLWLEGPSPPTAADLTGVMSRLQVHGGTVLGWCPDDLLTDAPAAALATPAVSAATFPIRF
jgi:hypothetical protein